VGGGAPQIAPAMACKLCMILSSAECTGVERYKWQNLAVSKMTWLLVLALTNLKQR
jgi:hypothetical protein